MIRVLAIAASLAVLLVGPLALPRGADLITLAIAGVIGQLATIGMPPAERRVAGAALCLVLAAWVFSPLSA